MPSYSYEAIDSYGNTVRGSLVAENREAVLARMREMRYRVVDIAAGRERGGFSDFLQRFQTVKLRELVVFSRQFSTMINAGMTVIKCLDILSIQSKNQFFRQVVSQVKVDISAGLSLADALAKHPRVFSDLYVNMIRAAELGGILDTILDRVSSHLESEAEIRTKIKSAMMYPTVVFFFALAMISVIVFGIVPKFKDIFTGLLGPEVPLPPMTRLLMSIGDNAQKFWFIPLILIVGGVVAYKLIGRTETGKYRIDKLKLKIPVVGELILKISIARVCRTLGTLLSSGIPVLRALEIVHATAGNAVVAQAVTEARDRVHEGERMAEPFERSGIFPTMTVQMIQVGEETGRLDEMLNKVAKFYEDEVDALVKGLTSLIEPLMIVGLGMVVAFIAIAVIGPLYKVISQLSEAQ